MNPIRFSQLKHMKDSPKHYKYRLDHPLEQSRAMRVGTAVHYLLLGGEPYQVFHGRRQGEKWIEFESQYAGMTILNEGEEQEAIEIAESVRQDGAAELLLARCAHKELQIDWKLGSSECSSRLDGIGPGFIVDLKVSHTANPSKFVSHAIGQSWHAQLSFYDHAANWQWSTIEQRDLYVIAVEPKPPYVCQVFNMNKLREQGERLWRGWFEQLQLCIADDYWPAYSERIVEAAPPEWTMAVEEGEDEAAE